MAKHPHLLIFNPDSYRGDVQGHLGNTGAVTPALDAFVADGAVSYRYAFAQNPVCTPSRCSFMTGWYPHAHGHRSMKNMLKPHEPNLLSVLRREGYHVWWGGKNDLVAVQKADDYLQYCDTRHRPSKTYRGYRMPEPLSPDDPRHGAFYSGVMPRDAAAEYHDHDAAWVDGAVDLVKNYRLDKPLCIFLTLGCPHPPYRVEQEFYDRIDPTLLPPRAPVPPDGASHPAVLDALRKEYQTDRMDESAWREVKRIYYAMCTKVDHLFGRMVKALRDAGLYDDTFIIFLSDHGDFTGDYSLPEKTHSTLQDCLLRVPLLMKPPAGHAVHPGVRDHLVELVDMTATIYDLLGIAPGYDVQGKSLRGSLAGESDRVHDAVFAEVGSRPGEEAFNNRDVARMPPRSFYPMQARAAMPFAARGTYAVSCRTDRYKYIRRGYSDCHELYDLASDPHELNNLRGDPAMATVEQQCQTLLLDYFLRTGDILPHQQDSRTI